MMVDQMFICVECGEKSPVGGWGFCYMSIEGEGPHEWQPYGTQTAAESALRRTLLDMSFDDKMRGDI
jgi:hypothetical protein